MAGIFLWLDPAWLKIFYTLPDTMSVTRAGYAGEDHGNEENSHLKACGAHTRAAPPLEKASRFYLLLG